ncbi:MAG: DUF255 domain-containing protein [Bacteroidia bacterium]|nr:DUF255 domain-containing protein [Bacteroidia bacterium]
MTKKVSIIISLLLVTAFLFVSSFRVANQNASEGEKIEWLDFQVGYDKAVKEKKMILIDSYTDWCGWCKRMDKNTYSDKKIIEKVNANFVAIKLNPELDARYMVGEKVMSGYELLLWLGKGRNYGYPTTFFWVAPHKDENVEMAVGYKASKEFEEMLDYYISKK